MTARRLEKTGDGRVERVGGWRDGWRDRWMDGWMDDGWMEGWMGDGWISKGVMEERTDGWIIE